MLTSVLQSVCKAASQEDSHSVRQSVSKAVNTDSEEPVDVFDRNLDLHVPAARHFAFPSNTPEPCVGVRVQEFGAVC